MNSDHLKNIFSCYLIGDDSLLIQCAKILLEEKQNILGIITSDHRVSSWANEHDIICFENDSTLLNKLNEPFDYLFSIANLKVIHSNLLSIPQKGAINFHDGPLPKYAGLNAPSWAILNGEETHGITWHLMTDKIDEGDILIQELFDISTDDTAFTLNAKCFEKGVRSFKILVKKLLTNSVEFTKQESSQISYFSKFKKPQNLGFISWESSARDIYNLVRGLNFGNYPNFLTTPKIKIEDENIVVKKAKIIALNNKLDPGTIVSITEESITIAANDDGILLQEFESLKGEPINLKSILSTSNLKAGDKFEEYPADKLKKLSDYYNDIAGSEPFWLNRLSNLAEFDNAFKIFEETSSQNSGYNRIALNLPDILKKSSEQIYQTDFQEFIKICFSLFIGKLFSLEEFDIGYSHLDNTINNKEFNGIFSDVVPLKVMINYEQQNLQSVKCTAMHLNNTREKQTYIKDLISRFPVLKILNLNGTYPVLIKETSDINDKFSLDSKLILLNDKKNSKFYWFYDVGSLSEKTIKTLVDRFIIFVHSLLNNPQSSFSEISLVTPSERDNLLYKWNQTNLDLLGNRNIAGCLEQQVLKHGDSIAVVCDEQKITYSEFEDRTNLLAGYLNKFGIGKNSLVAVSMKRSVNALVSIFGILNSGAAYVPIDPAFPKDRIDYMLQDSKCGFLITDDPNVEDIVGNYVRVINIVRDWNQIACSESYCDLEISPDSLAYMIYTSGSTGKPKGVMVSHKNLLNFFSAMDEKIKYDEDSVWLAVTNLSFDISILELLWTILRGIKVVIYSGSDLKLNKKQSPKTNRLINFSLFYFSSYEGEKNKNKYDLLIEGAKYADKNNFTAVWTPERHFYNFGGLYPNPSITSAAIAVITDKIHIRAGSVVSPLHSSIRIAEEWSMVDNLSHGRVGISFAAGWQPDDFVIMPENFEVRKEKMFKQIDEVQKLWKGESLGFTNPNGKLIQVKILPRPVQNELPIWVTAAGNPETFELAGKLGHNLLTHLLGQTLSELSEKIEIYRRAWKEAGHPGSGNISLMLHTFIGSDEKMVKETVRVPMKEYLKSAVNLVKEAAWSFPTFKNQTTATDGKFSMDDLSADELDAILDYSFERYYHTSGLFGTPKSCKKTVDKLKEIDVDEIACLIDFGVDSDLVLAHLHYLNQLKRDSNSSDLISDQKKHYSVASLIKENSVTHMQCTPSMARMLLIDDEVKDSLSGLDTLLIGGESFPVSLAERLLKIVRGNIFNMYGPTETTIWSTIHKVQKTEESSIPIGKPIANTQIYILDKFKQLLPIGIPGELYIGGEGVSNGYFNQPSLTEEKFIVNPFSEEGNTKIYRTGDLTRYREDGTVEFLGRIDDQVKIRGYRIELGEIESILCMHQDIKEAAVVSIQEDSSDVRLAAFILAEKDNTVDVSSVKNYLKERIPEYMLPAHYIVLPEFPLTPNGKLNRKILPTLIEKIPENKKTNYLKPSNKLEIEIANIWEDLLKVQDIGLNDNFFDCGGHSLLAVQLHSKIRDLLNIDLTLIDIFTYPTIRSMVEFINIKKENEITEPILPESKRIPLSKQRLNRIRSRNSGTSGD